MSTCNVTQLDSELLESIYNVRVLISLLSDQLFQLMELGSYDLARSEMSFILSQSILNLLDEYLMKV